MAMYSIHADLSAVLLEHCEMIRKQRRAVLFHRGDVACGMFLVLEGRVAWISV
jgi:CRP-like cAMP-binding protein